jgi:hypothetical protein
VTELSNQVARSWGGPARSEACSVLVRLRARVQTRAARVCGRLRPGRQGHLNQARLSLAGFAAALRPGYWTGILSNSADGAPGNVAASTRLGIHAVHHVTAAESIAAVNALLTRG